MLNPESREFYNRWRCKADAYEGDDVRDLFDRFVTQFVIYNRLYADATFSLASENRIRLDPDGSFPDGKAAKSYVAQYLGATSLIEALEADPGCAEAIRAVIRLLSARVSERQFFIILDKITGAHQPEEDKRLLNSLRSTSRAARAEGILEFLYAVRVNLIHGHKSFEPIQKEVVQPANVLLSRIIDILFERLNRD